MYAVVRTGGKQYKVTKDQVLTVESLAGDVGSKLTLSEVLMLGGVTDTLVTLSSGASNIKNLALLIGLVLLLAAIAARVQQRRISRGAGSSGPKIPGLL